MSLKEFNGIFPPVFKDLTVIIPAMDETYSLEETVHIILSGDGEACISKILIVLNEKRGTENCLKVARELERRNRKVEVLFQKRPFAGGALQDGFDIVSSSHVVMMSADLETDPHLIPEMIAQSKLFPEKIITVSRWGRGGGFQGYNKAKLYCNYVFQKLIAFMFFSTLTDITYAYRLIPTVVVKAVDWKELKHPMFLETAIVPMRLGVRFVEISGKWKARTEGVSQNSFMANFNYFKTAFRVRFSKKKSLKK